MFVILLVVKFIADFASKCHARVARFKSSQGVRNFLSLFNSQVTWEHGISFQDFEKPLVQNLYESLLHEKVQNNKKTLQGLASIFVRHSFIMNESSSFSFHFDIFTLYFHS